MANKVSNVKTIKVPAAKDEIIDYLRDAGTDEIMIKPYELAKYLIKSKKYAIVTDDQIIAKYYRKVYVTAGKYSEEPVSIWEERNKDNLKKDILDLIPRGIEVSDDDLEKIYMLVMTEMDVITYGQMSNDNKKSEDYIKEIEESEANNEYKEELNIEFAVPEDSNIN